MSVRRVASSLMGPVSQRLGFTTRELMPVTSLSATRNRQITVSAAAKSSEKTRGKVKWFNSTKGFGFITPEDGTDDLFVHQTSIISDGFRSLAEGEDVEFFVATGDDGRSKAVDVTGPDGRQPLGQSGERSSSFGGGRGGGYNRSSGGAYGGGGGGYGGGRGGGRSRQDNYY